MKTTHAPRALNCKLTDRKMKALKPKARPDAVTDGGGLQPEIATAGGKAWRYAYMTQARNKHQRIMTVIAQGIDPMRQRKLDAIDAVATKAQEQVFKDFGEIWVNQELTTVTDRTRKQAVRCWADKAMYRAKKAGRNCIDFHPTNPTKTAS